MSRATESAIDAQSAAQTQDEGAAIAGATLKVAELQLKNGVDVAADSIDVSSAIVGDRTLTLFVKREGSVSWAEVSLTSDATVARLTKAIVVELDIKEPLDSLTLHVARDEAGKDLGDALNSRHTLAAANLQAGASIGVKVAARMAVLPAPPAPITFEDTDLLDAVGAAMHVARLVSMGPFFLEDMAFQQIKSWASGHPCKGSNYKLLVLTGPIKCGKTTMLREVLPAVLAAQQAAAGGGPTPVIFEFAFSLQEGPPAAAKLLCDSAATFADKLGIVFPYPRSTPIDYALINMGAIMGELANGIAAAGGELILLIDEAQVR
jgi:hypothetical protein